MDTNKAAYWIALGVFALALNGEYRHGRFVPLHRVSEFAASALCSVAARAEQTLAVARVLTSREPLAVDDLPENQRSDVAFLFTLVEDPDELASQISANERRWLRRHPYFGDPHDACWTGIIGAEDGAIVYRRLTAGPSSSSS